MNIYLLSEVLLKSWPAGAELALHLPEQRLHVHIVRGVVTVGHLAAGHEGQQLPQLVPQLVPQQLPDDQPGHHRPHLESPAIEATGQHHVPPLVPRVPANDELLGEYWKIQLELETKVIRTKVCEDFTITEKA